MAKLDDYFDCAHNLIQAIYDFNLLKQQAAERIKEFEISVRKATAECRFENPEERVLEQLICCHEGQEIRQFVADGFEFAVAKRLRVNRL